MTVALSDGTTTVTVDEIVAAALSRPLRREAVAVLNDDDYLFLSGTPGKLAGSITYLCASVVDAFALDTLYRSGATVTLTTGTGAALNGLAHLAVGDVRLAAEKTVPGKPSRWTVQAEIREVA